MKKILLIGQKMAGKTTLGHLLAKEFKTPFFDSDELLQKRFKEDSIRTLFEKLGEKNFRLEERAILNTFSSFTQGVFSIGAGALDLPIDSNFFDSFFVVFLEISKPFFFDKMQNDHQYAYFDNLLTKFDTRQKLFDQFKNIKVPLKKEETIDVSLKKLKYAIQYGQ